MSFNYDLFVIGAGSGGVRAARVAAEHGAKVAIAEGDRCGGTCVIRGCVPKKLMVFASEFSQVSEMAKGYGWNFEPTRFDQFDWSAFHKKRAAEISRLEGVYQRILRDKGVERFDRNAKMTGPNEVELSSGEKYTAKYILIATGAQPVVPKDVVGAEHSITSNDIFDLPELPESLLIIGAGYIACEFACILHNLGARVQMWIRSNKILSAFDHEATSVIKDSMARSGIEMEYSRRVTKIVKEADGKLTVTDNNGTESKFSKVFFATGRSPNVSNLGLESVGIKLDRAGAIVVDEFSQTACPSIYAVGDVTNRMNLTPVAIREAMAFVNTVFKGVPTRMDYTCIPSAVFTQPELGTVGLSEEAARALGPIEIYKSTFNPMRTAFAGIQASVFLKLVVCKNTRVVLGCHIVAPQAGELIQMIAIAVKMRVTKEMFDSTVGVHPTLSEEIVTLRTPSE